MKIFHTKRERSQQTAKQFLQAYNPVTPDGMGYDLLPSAEDKAHAKLGAYDLVQNPAAYSAVRDALVTGMMQEYGQTDKKNYLADVQAIDDRYLGRGTGLAWDAAWKKHVNQDDMDFLKFEGRIALMGASGGLLEGVAGAGLIANMAKGSRTGSIVQFLLTSRTGTALTGGLVNAADQKIENGHINWVDVGASAAGGWAGYGRGALWNSGVGFVTGAADTEANNIIYGKDDSVWLEGSIGAAGTGLGFKAGKRAEGVLERWDPSSMNNVIIGNAVGTAASDYAGYGVDTIKQKINTKKCVSNHANTNKCVQ